MPLTPELRPPLGALLLPLALLAMALLPAAGGWAQGREVSNSPTTIGGDGSAQTFVRETVAEVLTIHRSGDTPAKKRTRITGVIEKNFDFVFMTKYVLQSGWNQFDRAQQRQFVEEFSQALVRRYSFYVVDYEVSGVEIEDSEDRPRGDVIVHTRIIGGERNDWRISYRLRRRQGDSSRWKAIDVLVKDGSILDNYRDQFSGTVENLKADELLAWIQEHNESEERRLPDDQEVDVAARP